MSVCKNYIVKGRVTPIIYNISFKQDKSISGIEVVDNEGNILLKVENFLASVDLPFTGNPLFYKCLGKLVHVVCKTCDDRLDLDMRKAVSNVLVGCLAHQLPSHEIKRIVSKIALRIFSLKPYYRDKYSAELFAPTLVAAVLNNAKTMDDRDFASVVEDHICGLMLRLDHLKLRQPLAQLLIDLSSLKGLSSQKYRALISALGTNILRTANESFLPNFMSAFLNMFYYIRLPDKSYFVDILYELIHTLFTADYIKAKKRTLTPDMLDFFVTSVNFLCIRQKLDRSDYLKLADLSLEVFKNIRDDDDHEKQKTIRNVFAFVITSFSHRSDLVDSLPDFTFNKLQNLKNEALIEGESGVSFDIFKSRFDEVEREIVKFDIHEKVETDP